MRDESRRQEDIARLEQKRRLVNERMERQRQRVNDHFDRKQEQLSQRMNSRQEQIIAAAMQLLDAEGLNSLSLRRLAQRLDMQAPGLYWHFKNKDMLIDYMAEEILRDALSGIEPRQADEPWQDWMSTTLNRLRAAMLEHTDGARVVAGAHFYPAQSLAKFFELAAISLRSAGFELMTARNIIMTAVTYTFGYVIEEQASPDPILMDDNNVQKFLKEYPVTQEAMLATRKKNMSSGDDFNIGLQFILRGAESQMIS